MSYESFICPECESEINPQKSIFCKKCGVNLSNYALLKKKIFYEPIDYCWNCHQPGGLEDGPTQQKYSVEHSHSEDFNANLQDYLKDHLESVRVHRVYFHERKCKLCGALRNVETYWRTDYDNLCWLCRKPGAKEEFVREEWADSRHCGSVLQTYEQSCTECGKKREVQRRFHGSSYYISLKPPRK